MSILYRSMIVLLGDGGQGLSGNQAEDLSNAVLQLRGVAGLSIQEEDVDMIVGELVECIEKRVPMKYWPEFVGRYYAEVMDKALGFKDDNDESTTPDKEDEKVCMTIRQVINWDEQPLGKVTDTELAKKLGVSGVAVGRARRRRKIPAFNHRDGHRRPQGSRAGVDWDKQPLGKEMDSEIAMRLGVDRSSVRSARVARGIKAIPNPDHSLRIGRIKAKKDAPTKDEDAFSSQNAPREPQKPLLPTDEKQERLRIRRREEIIVIDEPIPRGHHVHRCPTCREDTQCNDESCEPKLDNEDGVPMIYTTCQACIKALANKRNDGTIPIGSSNFGPAGRFG